MSHQKAGYSEKRYDEMEKEVGYKPDGRQNKTGKSAY